MRTNNPKILGLIPARAGSRGVPGKHMKLLGNKPLIEYTFRSALQARLLSKVILSTDSDEIINFAKDISGIEIPFKRPANFAMDNTPTISVINHALQHYRSAGQLFDFVCLLQPTTPFRSEDLIDRVINYLLKSGAESVVTVRKVPDNYHPNWLFSMDSNGKLKNARSDEKIIPRRQDLPAEYHRDGQVYIAATELIERGFLMGNNTHGFINEDGPGVNIDTPADWEMAENWLTNGK